MSRRNRRRRMDVKLPGGTVARVDRDLTSADMGRLVAQEQDWLRRFRHMEEQAHAQLVNGPRPATDVETKEAANGRIDGGVSADG